MAIGSGWNHYLAIAGDGTPVFPTAVKRRTVSRDSTLTLAALAAGRQSMACQWRLNGEDISGATNSTLVILNAETGAAGLYDCVVSNEVAEAYGEDLTSLIDSISALITTEVLLDLNGRVELQAENPEDVASDWLSENGVLGG